MVLSMKPNERVLVTIGEDRDPYTIIRFLRSEMVQDGNNQHRYGFFWSSLMRCEVRIREKSERKLRLNNLEYTIRVERVDTDRIRVVFRSRSLVRFKKLIAMEEM